MPNEDITKLPMTETRSEIYFRQEARKYVDTQLEVMRKYGSESVLSPAEYDSIVTEVANAGKKLWTRTGGLIESARLPRND